MRFISYLSTLGVILAYGLSPAHADEPKFGCFELFTAADKDRNGVIEKGEDESGYLAILSARGVKTLAANAVSRDEFVRECKAGAFQTAGSGKAPTGAPHDPGSAGSSGADLPKDLGKGDITPGPQRLLETEARARLRASGFAEVDQLTLDEQGVWRGTAVVNGKRVAVAVDGQGDIVGGK